MAKKVAGASRRRQSICLDSMIADLARRYWIVASADRDRRHQPYIFQKALRRAMLTTSDRAAEE